MSKRTWRWRGCTDDVKAVMANAKSYADAAAKLGTDKSTIYRWIRSGKLPRPGGGQRRAMAVAEAVDGPQSAAAWATWVRATFALSATEGALLALAVAALELAQDASQKPEIRLSAAGRFQQLVKQLNFEEEQSGEAATYLNRSNTWPPRRVS